MTVDIGNLLDLVDGGVTQPVKSETLESVIPANLRGADGKWYALSLRDRVLYVEKDLKLESFRYEDLADPSGRARSASAPASTLQHRDDRLHDRARRRRSHREMAARREGQPGPRPPAAAAT